MTLVKYNEKYLAINFSPEEEKTFLHPCRTQKLLIFIF